MNGERKSATAVQDQYKAALEKQAIAKLANAMPLPGELVNGFPADSRVVEAITIRPVVASDLAVMQKLNSSLYLQMMESQKDEKQRQPVEISFQDMIDAVWLFSVPAVRGYKQVSLGVESFREQSVNEIGSRLKPEQIAELFAAVASQTEVIFATAISFGTDGEQQKKVREVFFRVSPVSNTTDSAGG